MNRKSYLKRNAQVRDIVLKNNIEYASQFSHNGKKVTRTKFWHIFRSSRGAFPKVKVNKALREINELSYVAYARLDRDYHSSIYVKYK